MRANLESFPTSLSYSHLLIFVRCIHFIFHISDYQAYMHMYHMCAWGLRGRKRAQHTMGLELEMVVRHHVVAEICALDL